MSYLFKNNWTTYDDNFNALTKIIQYKVDLPLEFFQTLKFDPDSLKQYRVNAALETAKDCGDKPVLCLSGGIDSQAMVQCWQEADLEFDVAIMAFKDDLNTHDVSIALQYCEQHCIKPIVYELDVVKFLTRESPDFHERYSCSSPHFVTHYKFFDWLREQYSGIVCGGNALAPGKAQWGPGLTAAQINFVEYSRVNNYPVMGNFLGYDPELCLTIAILTPKHQNVWTRMLDFTPEQEDFSRYDMKLLGYQRHGFDLIPQSQKYTGFEKVKDHFKSLTGDGWTFEKRFRHPWQKKFSAATGEIILTAEQNAVLDDLNLKYSISN